VVDTNTIIIGGGQAGLAMSYQLTQRSIEHVILERRRVAERWHAERWDSLAFQFPNWSLELPGHSYQGDQPDAFAGKAEVTRFIEEYAQKIEAPVECGVNVISLERDSSDRFVVRTEDATLKSANVVLATGPYHHVAVPEWSSSLPGNLMQLTANQYFNPAQLPEGSVLVVGSGSSGTQIAEELYQSGRTVFLSVSAHRRAPRRYRGHDLCRWLFDAGHFDKTIDELPGRKPPPALAITGVDGGHDIDVRRFAAQGVVLLGRFLGVEDRTLGFADDLEKNLDAADQSLVDFKRSCDDCVLERGVDVEEAVEDEPRDSASLETIATLDIASAEITSVIWCTGYRLALDWVRLPVFGEGGLPVQRRGVTSYPGAYFLGLNWMHTLKSSTLFGVGEDAEFVADAITKGSVDSGGPK
jgi:putative flavoprotein involved in K+ transport